MVPGIDARISLMNDIYAVWSKHNDSAPLSPIIPKLIETIESRVALYAYNNNLSHSEYNGMIYRICVFLMKSESFTLKIKAVDASGEGVGGAALERLIEELKNMNIQNMTHMDEAAFETQLIELEMRKMDVVKAEISNAYTCRYCHKNETTYYVVQTRASDEGKTVFYKCVNCKNYGRIST